MKILGIETSCDETALAVIEGTGDQTLPQFSVRNTALYSQIDIHKEYGGVFPALAKREHAKNLVPLLAEVLAQEETTPFDATTVDWETVTSILEREPTLFEQLKNFVETHEKPAIDVIAVTSGPGLEPALWVGINFAKALSLIWNIPVLPINHMEGHIVSTLLDASVSEFPALALLISGGHTEIVLVNNWGDYTLVGQTRDDAIGEAYDKVARMLDLPYPGGPQISKLAQEARDNDSHDETISFPRPMQHTHDFDFSLSGLKTAVLYKTQELMQEHGALHDAHKVHIAREFEQAVVDVVITKTKKAIEKHNVSTLLVGGGVIANQYIRTNLEHLAQQEGVSVYFPSRELSTDNAVMIAVAGFLKSFRTDATINPHITAEGSMSLSS